MFPRFENPGCCLNDYKSAALPAELRRRGALAIIAGGTRLSTGQKLSFFKELPGLPGQTLSVRPPDVFFALELPEKTDQAHGALVFVTAMKAQFFRARPHPPRGLPGRRPQDILPDRVASDGGFIKNRANLLRNALVAQDQTSFTSFAPFCLGKARLSPQLCFHDLVHGRDQNQRDQGGKGQAPHHRNRQRPPHLCPLPPADGHGQHSQEGCQHRHQDRPEPPFPGFKESLAKAHAPCPQKSHVSRRTMALFTTIPTSMMTPRKACFEM